MSRDAPAGPGLCNCQALRRAARRTTALYDTAMAPFGLRISQYAVLNRLRLAGPMALQALAAELGLDRTTLGRNLRPLEREGLVTMTIDPQDRRGRTLDITGRGRAKLAEARIRWAAAQAAFEAGYGATETQTLHATLDTVARLDFGGR